MSQGRGSAILATTMVLCLMLVLYCEVAHAATYTVGDASGWSFNVAGWPNGKNFMAGDTLDLYNVYKIAGYDLVGSGKIPDEEQLYCYVEAHPHLYIFNYNPAMHNVVVVNEAGYSSCNAPAGAKVYNTGIDQINLVKGQNFFICSFPGHCAAGMKIAITAM